MLYRKFGGLDWSVGEIGYGMWGLAGWTGSDDVETTAALERAVALGCNFFDTAWAYGNGQSELALGRLVQKPSRQRALCRHQSAAQELQVALAPWLHARRLFPARPHSRVRRKSLENLDLPRIDLLQFHVWEDAWARDERWQRAIDDLKHQGLIRAAGVSVNRWEPTERDRDHQDRTDRRRSVHLQHLRPGPKTSCFRFAASATSR